MADQHDDSRKKPKAGAAGPIYSDDIDSILARNRTRNPPLETDEIVRIITRGESYPTVREMAKKWAEKLGISIAEFVRLAGRRS